MRESSRVSQTFPEILSASLIPNGWEAATEALLSDCVAYPFSVLVPQSRVIMDHSTPYAANIIKIDDEARFEITT